MTTERDMLGLLAQRYTAIRQGTIADRWAVAEHVRATLGIGGGIQRICDFIAADKYPGMPYGTALAMHGHEVKVSRADWLSELRDPEKAETFKRHMHHWWLVVPDATIVRPGELPEGWGLLVPDRTGKLRAKVPAPRLNPEPVPLDLTISLMAAAARTAHRAPLHRDAPDAFVKTWDPRCGWCGELGPCAIHQPRQAARKAAA